jgi:hypothetical protein
MNANELAFELDKVVPEQDVDLLVLVEAADMIRQQAAEIAVLRAENKFFKDLMGDVEILRGSNG